jgi:MFS family permease
MFSWRAIFYVNIPIGILAAVSAYWLLKGGAADVSRREPFDWPGALLLCCSLVCFFLALVKALDWGFASEFTLGLMGISVLTGLWLVLLELRARHPVFDPSLLKVRLFFLPVVSASILFASLFTIVFLMPFFLVNPFGLPIDKAGYTMAIPFVCLFFVSPFSGALSDRIGSRWLCTVGMAVLAASLFFMCGLSASSSYLDVVWRLVVAGVGTSIFLPPNSSIVMSALPAARRGIAAGTVATARNIGMVVGVSLAGLIFNSIFRLESGGADLKIYAKSMEPHFMAAFESAMLAGAVMASIGVLVSYLRGDDKNDQ